MRCWRGVWGEVFFLTARASRTDKWSCILPRFLASSRSTAQSCPRLPERRKTGRSPPLIRYKNYCTRIIITITHRAGICQASTGRFFLCRPARFRWSSPSRPEGRSRFQQMQGCGFSQRFRPSPTLPADRKEIRV